MPEVFPSKKGSIVDVGSLVVQYLAWECCDITPIVHYSEDGWGRKHHDTLFIRVGSVSGVVHSELDVSILFRRLFWSNFGYGGTYSGSPFAWHWKLTLDCVVCRFRVHLFHQGFERT
jgi:hypothetical protein